MPDKNEIGRRKQIKRELIEKANLEFEQSLPISRERFKMLFDFLDEHLSENGCDDTLTLTRNFLEENQIINAEKVIGWLNENGGYCDCEVLYNVEEQFEI
ncbi:DUF2695 domain-containing protein [Chryseobacterium sp. SSA4.19]|uniref:DUF2695 domain-containing protein n=1 Tax=Chryseobacterium sp. SSA4.19 TaxID=2919915 RepID=UPI001F4E9FA9|nr:DUF2695 domain-containing protein [Chryseobacterium sp. SSA4.19]MCJ8154720.1 DUF2695 domain-containing protein [Chryseobacterium sp. SSA4.19]